MHGRAEPLALLSTFPMLLAPQAIIIPTMRGHERSFHRKIGRGKNAAASISRLSRSTAIGLASTRTVQK